jgi:hypothetical protein
LDFSNDTEILNFMQIHPLTAQLFHAEGQTGGLTDRHDELTVDFHNFSKSPKIAEHE